MNVNVYLKKSWEGSLPPVFLKWLSMNSQLPS